MKRIVFLTILSVLSVLLVGSFCYADDSEEYCGPTSTMIDHAPSMVDDSNLLFYAVRETAYKGDAPSIEKMRKAEKILQGYIKKKAGEDYPEELEKAKIYIPIRLLMALRSYECIFGGDEKGHAVFCKNYGNSAIDIVLERELRKILFNTMAGEYDKLLQKEQEQKAEIVSNSKKPYIKWRFTKNYYGPQQARLRY